MVANYSTKKVEKSKKLEQKVFSWLKKFESGDKEAEKKFEKITRTCVKGQSEILKKLGIQYEFFDYESNYLNESKKFIYAIIVVFFLSFIFGFFVPTPDAVAEKIFEIINELIEETEGMSQTGLISFIFLNNGSKAKLHKGRLVGAPCGSFL